MGKTFKMPAGMAGGATFSGNRPGRRRTSLFRWWGTTSTMGWSRLEPKDKVLVIGHNPSEAGGSHNDPTILKVCTFALAWGYRGVIMHNLMDHISDDPAHLLPLSRAGHRLCEPENLANIMDACDEVDKTICAWGKVRPELKPYEKAVVTTLEAYDQKLWCIEENADGSPKHPLYIEAASQPIPWEKANAFK